MCLLALDEYIKTILKKQSFYFPHLHYDYITSLTLTTRLLNFFLLAAVLVVTLVSHFHCFISVIIIQVTETVRSRKKSVTLITTTYFLKCFNLITCLVKKVKKKSVSFPPLLMCIISNRTSLFRIRKKFHHWKIFSNFF